MGKCVLKVTYKVRVHQMKIFEEKLKNEVLPLAEQLGLDLKGVWKSLVGNVGEYVELWEFESLDEFDTKWKGLIRHPKLQEVFQITGEMVDEEVFALYEPIWEK